jgi:stage V sporulation protein G
MCIANKNEVMMIVTEVNISFIKPKDSLIGFASVLVDGELYLGSIGIHRKLHTPESFRLTYPSKSSGEQQFQIFHPISKRAAQAIERAIFDKLKDVMSKRNAGYDCANPESAAI